MQRFCKILKAVYGNYFADLGTTDLSEDSTLTIIKLNVFPHEGIHTGLEYTITIKFQDEGQWPLVYIDSKIFDKIKTNQYLKNKGKNGNHKGICIQKLCYGYNFENNFKTLCDDKWENYIYYLITLFNNIEDFEKGNGIKSSYKKIIQIGNFV